MGEVVGIAMGGVLGLTVPNRPDLIRDRVITWLQRARTTLGLLAGVWLVMAYPLRKGREEFVLDKLENRLRRRHRSFRPHARPLR
ncbi:hypothetical protein [Streptomyces sp. NPDC057438]|uniref:hypothetical protein n=1 Tax=Streptomyces sp. NPDC057438 TaxID=3346133 RepID=UPI0036A0F313